MAPFEGIYIVFLNAVNWTIAGKKCKFVVTVYVIAFFFFFFFAKNICVLIEEAFSQSSSSIAGAFALPFDFFLTSSLSAFSCSPFFVMSPRRSVLRRQ